MQETQVQSLDREDPLEEVLATHSSILAWRIPWTEEPGRLQSMESQSRTQLSDLHFWQGQRPQDFWATVIFVEHTAPSLAGCLFES